jgi:hypothetical protein
MPELKRAIRSKLASRKESGWRDMCFEKGSGNVRTALISQIGDSLANGKEPTKAIQVASDMLFNGVDVLDVDVMMRLI